MPAYLIIMVIKSIFLSNLNHLFSSLPNPDSSYLESLNYIFFKFIWPNKPDKIKREMLHYWLIIKVSLK